MTPLAPFLCHGLLFDDDDDDDDEDAPFLCPCFIYPHERHQPRLDL